VGYLLLALSDLTAVWQLYLGLFFIAVVMFAPGGITGLLMKHRPLVRAGTLFTVLRAYLVALVPTLTTIAGLILAIEIVVQHTVNAGEDPNTKAVGVRFNAASPLIWLLAAVLVIGGFVVARRTWRWVGKSWDEASSPHAKKDSRMTSHAVELRGVQKSFGNTSVIHDVNLTVVKGERHALDRMALAKRPCSI
jgi:branched-chain amino acid transport system permease protein